MYFHWWSNHMFPEIYELLLPPWVSKNLLYQLSASNPPRGGVPLRFAPSSSVVDGADDTRERVPTSIFNIAPAVTFRILVFTADPSLGRPSLLATLSAHSPRQLPRRFLCGCTYVLKCNKLNWNQIISEPSLLKKNILSYCLILFHWNQSII